MAITTISVDTETAAKLDRLAKANKVAKKEYISYALNYFEKYGINPVVSLKFWRWCVVRFFPCSNL